MSKTIIEAPFLDVNTPEIEINTIHVKNFEFVKQDDLIFTIETLKVSEDILAPIEGYFLPLVCEGEKVEAKLIIGYIFSEKNEAEDFRKTELPKIESQELKIEATKKAIMLAKKYKIDINKIPQTKTIREIDVKNYYMNSISKQEIEDDKKNTLEMESNFLTDIANNKKVFSKLSSSFKINLYKQFGAQINNKCEIGENSIIIAKKIYIGENCYIGENVEINADELWIGDGVTITEKCKINTKYVEIGKGTGIIEETRIGGGSAFELESGIKIGENSLIIESVINTTKLVKIGNRTAISPGCRLFTHHHWQSVLLGGIVNFKGINIGDDVHITNNCTIAPGVIIGNSILVLSNSNIDREIESNTIVGGNPIKIISDQYLTRKLPNKKIKDIFLSNIIPDINTHIQNKGFNDVVIDLFENSNENTTISIITDKQSSLLAKKNSKNTVIDLFEEDIYGIVDEKLAHEVKYILRKYGLRFKPIGWRY